jgi:hypothetical protein
LVLTSVFMWHFCQALSCGKFPPILSTYIYFFIHLYVYVIWMSNVLLTKLDRAMSFPIH